MSKAVRRPSQSRRCRKVRAAALSLTMAPRLRSCSVRRPASVVDRHRNRTARVACLALASAGRIQARSRDASVVIGCWNDSMTLEARDRTSGKTIAAPPRFDAQPSASALGPDERLVGTTYSDGSLAVWDTGSGAVIHRFEVRGNTTQACSISPDGTRLIAGGKDHLVRLWDVAAGKKEATLAGHSGGVTCCEFSPDARVIASEPGTRPSTSGTCRKRVTPLAWRLIEDRCGPLTTVPTARYLCRSTTTALRACGTRVAVCPYERSRVTLPKFERARSVQREM